MHVLITGANGFIGRHVAMTYASVGAKVRGVGHGALTKEEIEYYGLSCWHAADISIDNLVSYGGEPDIIVHCAGSGSVPFSMAHPYQDFIRTVDTTATVLEYMRIYCPKAVLVYPSSAAVYGVVDSLPISETSTLKPVSPYGAHKVMAEQICHSYAINFNLPVVIVRLYSIYGEGLKKQLLWDACCKMLNDNFVFFGTGKELRDWLHVEDAARLLMVAADLASPDCPIVNGGSGIGISVRDVLSELIKDLNYVQALDFNGESRVGDPPGLQADISMLRGLDWKPSISWKEGMRRYANWFRQEHA